MLVEDNYFFRLSAFADRLLEWYDADPDCIQPDGKRNEAAGIVRQGRSPMFAVRTRADLEDFARAPAPTGAMFDTPWPRAGYPDLQLDLK